MSEVHLDLQRIFCPRCAGALVLRLQAEERKGAVHLTLDTACVSCGVSPWSEPDLRALIFRPGAPVAGALAGAAADYATELLAAQSRIDSLLHRCQELERALESARRGGEERQRHHELEEVLRSEISRLEGSLADARAEVRKAEEATKGALVPGHRAIELE